MHSNYGCTWVTSRSGNTNLPYRIPRFLVRYLVTAVKRAVRVVGIGCLGLFAMTGCTSANGSSPMPSTTGATASAASPSSTGLPQVQALGPVTVGAQLLRATEGQGKSSLALGALAHGSRKVNLRIACLGPGAARITDATGALVLNVAGCDAKEVYTTTFDSASADQTLRLATAAETRWQLAVWAK